MIQGTSRIPAAVPQPDPPPAWARGGPVPAGAHAGPVTGADETSPTDAPGPPAPRDGWRDPITIPGMPVPFPDPRDLPDIGDRIVPLHPRSPRGDDDAPAAGEDDRGSFGKAAVYASMAGGVLRSALDGVRTVAKIPEAARRGRLSMALSQLAMIAPDTNLIDPTAPRVASAASGMKSFTRLDELGYKASTLIGAPLSLLQLGSSVPNLVEAVHKDGWGGLGDTTAGRTGVLQLVGGGLGTGLFGAALYRTRAASTGGAMHWLMTAAKDPLPMHPVAVKLGIASALAVTANEIGFFDMFNEGDERPVGQVLRDAAHKVPVINDHTRRGALLATATAAATATAGYRAISAGALAGGGLKSLAGTIGRGPLITGGIAAGLLGAHLLGGLDALDS